VNSYNLRGGRRADIVVAVAGPLSNLLVAALVAIPLRLILASPGLIGPSPAVDFVLSTAEYFLFINIVLMVFNLLPIPPLDGWHALLGFVDTRTAYNLRQMEQYGFIVLLAIVFFGGRIIGDIVTAIERLLLGI
jgi:Zn-dependent protease